MSTEPDVDWMDRAACKGMDPELFYPERCNGAGRPVLGSPANMHIAAARAVCTECPVRDECLEYAITTNEQRGVWGGATVRQRRRIKQGCKVNIR